MVITMTIELEFIGNLSKTKRYLHIPTCIFKEVYFREGYKCVCWYHKRGSTSHDTFDDALIEAVIQKLVPKAIAEEYYQNKKKALDVLSKFVDSSDEADAKRFRWLLDGNGYFMEENFLCSTQYTKEDQNKARVLIDKEIADQRKALPC